MQRFFPARHKCTDPMPRWESEVTPVALPASRRMATTIRTAGLTYGDLLGRNIRYTQLGVTEAGGINGFSTPDANNAKSYALASLAGKKTRDWTQADCEGFAAYLSRSGMVFDQFVEPTGSTPADRDYIMGRDHTGKINWQQYVWTVVKMAEIAQASGGVVGGQYAGAYQTDLAPGGGWNPLAAEFVAALQSPAAARAGLWWFEEPLLSRRVSPLVQMYFPQANRLLVYARYYSMQRMRLACQGWAEAGYDLAATMYLWCQHIAPTDAEYAYHNRGYAYERTLPGGRLYTHWGVPASPNGLLSLSVSALILGRLAWWEDGVRYSGANPAHHEQTPADQPPAVWKAFAGAAAPAARTEAQRPNYPPAPQGVYSIPLIAQHIVGSMMAAGGDNWRFGRFMLPNTSLWMNPRADRADVLDAANRRGGWVDLTQSGSGYGIRYANPFGPERGGERITVDLGDGNTASFDQYGDEDVWLWGNRDWVGDKYFPRSEAQRAAGAHFL